MKIYKYLLPISINYAKQDASWDRIFDIGMPEGSTPLSVGIQAGKPVMWASVNPNSAPVSRTIAIVATGEQVPPQGSARFLGTLMLLDGGIVLHVFEIHSLVMG